MAFFARWSIQLRALKRVFCYKLRMRSANEARESSCKYSGNLTTLVRTSSLESGPKKEWGRGGGSPCLYVLLVGHFGVVFYLFFKASPGA